MNIRCLPEGKTAPNAILEMAKSWEMREVIVIGFDTNDEFVAGSSDPSLKAIAWMLKHADVWLTDNM